MCIRYLPLCLLLMPGISVSAEADAGDAMIEAQKQKLENLQVELNKTGSDIYDEIVTPPASAEETGCLDSIRMINVDMIPVDPSGMLSGVIAALKQELMDMACEAVNEQIEKVNEAMEQKLEVPYVITLETDTGSQVSDWGNLSDTDITLESSQAASDITNTVLGENRTSEWRVRQNMKQMERQLHKDNGTKPVDTSEAEKYYEEMLDVDTLWGGKPKSEGGSN